MKKQSLLLATLLICGTAYGQNWGINSSRTDDRNDAGLMGNAGAQSGFYQAPNPVNFPAGATSWWHLLDVRHSNPDNNYAMQIAGSFFDQFLYFRKTNNNASQLWQKFMATDDNDVLTSNNKIVIQTAGGQSFFTGHQLGGGYSFPQGIFRAIADNANGSANYFFDGIKYDGAGNYQTTYSVRADGQGYFAGNVGIGTTNPTRQLEVVSGTGVGPLKVSGPNGSLLIDNVGSGQSYYQANAFHQFQGASGVPILTMVNGGNVGIGTTNPNANLEVKGITNWDMSTVLRITNNTGDYGRTNLVITGRIQDGNDSWQFGTSARNSIVFAENAASSGTNIGAAGDEKYSMQLEGNSNSLGFLSKQNGTAPNMVLAQNGNVGIGTTTPGAALSILNNTPTIQLFDADSNPADGSSMGKLAFGSGGAAWASVEASRNGGYLDDVSDLIFKTSFAGGAGGDGTNIERMRINHNGFVGIGTTTPSANLEVNTNTIIGTGGNKFNSALTLIKNGDVYGTDNPALVIKHSGNGSNIFGNPASDLGVIQISGFNTSVANKSINSNNNFFVFTNGTVGVNTSSVPAGYKLAIGGNAIAESMTVKLQSAWGDYVFKPTYKLMPLSEVKTYVDKNQHLPEIPSASQIEKDGLNLGEMNKILVKKVEELTLYLIEKDKQYRDEHQANISQQQQITLLKQQLEAIDQKVNQIIKQ